MVRYGWVALCATMLLVAGCADRQAERESQAERKLAAARDVEEDLDALREAIVRYAEIAREYPKTQAGEAARVRHGKLQTVQSLLADRDSVASDSLTVFYRRVCDVLPDYPPVVRKLGTLYYNEGYLLAPTAAMMQDKATVQMVLDIWAKQDSLWADYSFRPVAEDRKWRDLLCAQAVSVARAQESVKRYKQALDVVNRGLTYAAGDEAASQARVFAAFYTYCVGHYKDAIALAEEALSYEFLPEGERARAYHTIGLCYTYIYQESSELSDLDAAIKATNESVNIVPSASTKELLKELREQRQRLQNLPRS